VLNVSFLKEISEIDHLPPRPADAADRDAHQTYWLEGFGVWSGAKPVTIEISISAPASRYYAAQTWHPDQDDSWDGDTLIRRFPGTPSPELNRRILSLGQYVKDVKPASILDELTADVSHLSSLCSRNRR
jgi:hypothetical protein